MSETTPDTIPAVGQAGTFPFPPAPTASAAAPAPIAPDPVAQETGEPIPVAALVSSPTPDPEVKYVDTPAAPATIDPKLRRNLLGLGGILTIQMANQGKMPDAVAANVGMDESKLLSIMTGSETDVTIRELSALAGDLGCTFAPQIIPPTSASK